MRDISESSPTRAMAEDLDVEAMLEAPYKKGVRLNFFSLLLCLGLLLRDPDFFCPIKST